MSDMGETDKAQSEQEAQDLPIDRIEEAQGETSQTEPGFRDRLRNLLNSVQHRSRTKTDLTKDRTRSLTLLIGGTIGAVLLFIGVFSTPARLPKRDVGSRTAPNLGRPSPGNQPAPAQGSVTPLLNADVRSNDISADQLGPADIRGTSRRASESDEMGNQEPPRVTAGSARLPRRAASRSRGADSTSVDRSDPLADTSTVLPAYGNGGPAVSSVGVNTRTFSYGGAGVPPTEIRVNGPSAVKSSIVFVRAQNSIEGNVKSAPVPISSISEMSSLQPGTRLIARLEVAATTAVKTPVVASIEYNYERDGMIIVPAGSKAIGDVQQASTDGYLTVRFHTLQMPNGREEKIEGTGVALDLKPLKGSVSGKNTGKKILSRTLAGVGTIAAYVVGGGGSRSSSTITGEALLRDRVAGNIALAGEQELMNATHSQNISVTVPANTRFYVVLQKAAGSSETRRLSQAPEPPPQPVQLPTAQELRELIELRREINQMYQESNRGLSGGAQ